MTSENLQKYTLLKQKTIVSALAITVPEAFLYVRDYFKQKQIAGELALAIRKTCQCVRENLKQKPIACALALTVRVTCLCVRAIFLVFKSRPSESYLHNFVLATHLSRD